MGQFHPLNQFFNSGFCTVALTIIGTGIIAAGITTLFIRFIFLSSRSFPYNKFDSKSISSNNLTRYIFALFLAIRKMTMPRPEIMRSKPQLKSYLKQLDNLQKKIIRESLLPIISSFPQNFPILSDRISESVQRIFAHGAVALFWGAETDDKRLTHLQHISQMAKWINEEVLDNISKKILKSDDKRLRGEMCFALGRSSNVKFKPILNSMLEDPVPWVQNQAAKALKYLEVTGTSDKQAESLSVQDVSELYGQIDSLFDKIRVLNNQLEVKHIKLHQSRLTYPD